jgi:hypothetical protein
MCNAGLCNLLPLPNIIIIIIINSSKMRLEGRVARMTEMGQSIKLPRKPET